MGPPSSRFSFAVAPLPGRSDLRWRHPLFCWTECCMPLDHCVGILYLHRPRHRLCFDRRAHCHCLLGHSHPHCSLSHGRPEVAQKAPRSEAGKAQLAAASQKRGRVVDPRASVWKTHRCPAGLSGRSGLISLTPPTTVVRSMKTRLRTLMTPLSLLMGLSQVLARLLWPLVPPVPLPRRRGDRWGVFHSVTPPASSHEQTLRQVTTCFISLV